MIPEIHLFATLSMVGLVWFVQLVQYPLFGKVGEASFPEYHRTYLGASGRAIAPLMLAEAGTALALIAASGFSGPLLWASLVLLAVIWLSTFLIQVPLHRTLESGFDPGAWRSLVNTNWIRTVAWTARGVLVLAWVSRS